MESVKVHPAGKPCQVEAQRRRSTLIARLGGACQDGFCFETECLQFDHPNGRDWEPRRLSRLRRIARYEAEAEAEAGLLRLLCKLHNRSDGAKRRWTGR